MPVRFNIRLSCAQAAIFAALLSSAAHAQEVPPTGPAGADATGGDIVVTAQKRSQILKDVPLAVSVVKAGDLLQKGQASLNDYFRTIPAVSMYDNGVGFKQIVIRGISTGFANTPTTAIYIDDTPVTGSTAGGFSDALVPDIDPGDLQRVEVLKGPQGTLYGASAMGGLLKYVTVPPDTGHLGGHGQADVLGVHDGAVGYGLRGAVNVPVVADVVGLRVSLSQREDPGYIDNVAAPKSNVNTAHVFNARGALLIKAAPDLTVTLNALYQRRKADGSAREDYDFGTNRPIYGDLEQSHVPGIEYDSQKQQIYNGTVKWHSSNFDIVSSTSYNRNKYNNESDASLGIGALLAEIAGFPDIGVASINQYTLAKFTQELRLSGAVDKLDWIGGAFYTNEDVKSYQYFNPVNKTNGATLGGLPFLADAGEAVHYNEYAFFGDATWHFTDAFSLQGGLRYSHNHQTTISTSSASLIGDSSSITTKSSEPVVTYVIAPQLKLSSETTLYGRVATGYRAGGANSSISGTDTTYNSDKSINYEAGIKSYLLERTVYLELAGFWINWDHVQLLTRNAYSEAVILNAGKARSRGIEGTIQVTPTHGLSLLANGTYDKAVLVDDAPTAIAGHKGDRLPYTPLWAGTISADYNWSAGRLNPSIGAEWSLQGGRYSEFQTRFSQPRIYFSAYSTVGAHAGVNFGRYSVNLYAKNILDKRAFVGANALLLSRLDLYTVSVIQPRTIGASIVAKF